MSEDHDRLEAMHEATKARQKAKEHTEFLEVLEACVAAIMTARMAIHRQFDTQRAMEELSRARFQADAVLAKYGRGRLARSEHQSPIPLEGEQVDGDLRKS